MLDYRWLIDGRSSYVRMQAAIVEEEQGEILVVGIMDIDSQIRREQQFNNELMAARRLANIDALTGVKNKHSYVEWEEKMNASIKAGTQEAFAIVVCDINDMKSVNDLYGHKEGDVCIQNAAKRICHIFHHSPVFRIGGDEFAIILTGRDYNERSELMEQLQVLPGKASKVRFGEVIAAGIADYQPGEHQSVSSVFELADHAMYEKKHSLKGIE
jgi:diguanylate cyclase (GGDEF)-like protein